MKKEKNMGYEDVLTDKEILNYSLVIDQFKNGEISFLNLKDKFLNYGIIVEPVLKDFLKDLMTVEEWKKFKDRIENQKYIYSDINYYLLNSNEFKNLVFRIDYKAIETLANQGVREYQEIMISILKTQLKHSYNKTEELAIKRSKWRRQIKEYESLLIKNDFNNLK